VLTALIIALMMEVVSTSEKGTQGRREGLLFHCSSSCHLRQIPVIQIAPVNIYLLQVNHHHSVFAPADYIKARHTFHPRKTFTASLWTS
jgi:hypothetical protein